MNVDELLARARSAIDGNCRYELGKGGRSHELPHPWDSRRRCDCSGFTSWALGLNRRTDEPFYVRFNEGWINTDAMWVDAVEPVGIFRQLSQPKPGCIAVYPGNRRRPGHCGIISTVSASGDIERIIHCAKGNYSRSGDAIQENRGSSLVSNSKTRFIWFELLESPEEIVRSAGNRFG